MNWDRLEIKIEQTQSTCHSILIFRIVKKCKHSLIFSRKSISQIKIRISWTLRKMYLPEMKLFKIQDSILWMLLSKRILTKYLPLENNLNNWHPIIMQELSLILQDVWELDSDLSIIRPIKRIFKVSFPIVLEKSTTWSNNHQVF
jgi:hypothetical protein